MGFFTKKNKDSDTGPVSETGFAEADGTEAALAADADGELLAVLAVAVAAYESDQYRRILNIRRTDRTTGTRPVWGIMGTQEAIDTRRM